MMLVHDSVERGEGVVAGIQHHRHEGRQTCFGEAIHGVLVRIHLLYYHRHLSAVDIIAEIPVVSQLVGRVVNSGYVRWVIKVIVVGHRILAVVVGAHHRRVGGRSHRIATDVDHRRQLRTHCKRVTGHMSDRVDQRGGIHRVLRHLCRIGVTRYVVAVGPLKAILARAVGVHIMIRARARDVVMASVCQGVGIGRHRSSQSVTTDRDYHRKVSTPDSIAVGIA